jgi:hypothetical protein
MKREAERESEGRNPRRNSGNGSFPVRIFIIPDPAEYTIFQSPSFKNADLGKKVSAKFFTSLFQEHLKKSFLEFFAKFSSEALFEKFISEMRIFSPTCYPLPIGRA